MNIFQRLYLALFGVSTGYVYKLDNINPRANANKTYNITKLRLGKHLVYLALTDYELERMIGTANKNKEDVPSCKRMGWIIPSHNNNAHHAANKQYWFAMIYHNNKVEHIAATRHSLSRALDRAAKNIEDIPFGLLSGQGVWVLEDAGI